MVNADKGRFVGFGRRAFVAAAALVLGLQLSGCGYNTLVSQKEAIGGQWSQVENQLQRRSDLIPNLVEVTKGYATHEKDVFDNIAKARAQMLGAKTRDAQMDAANQMSGALGRLLALAEAYPQLKADAQFTRLSDELAGTENRIATERRRYNDMVQTYNTSVKSLPTSLWSGWFGFTPEKYFEVSPGAQAVPQVKF
ncbi:MAG: LemA family protein [Alphaproteobacteria bacterium]